MAAIHGKRGKGKALEYDVEWVGYAERTWEPAALLANNSVLTAWLQAQKKTGKK